MKKLLTLFSALLLTVGMWGANEYNCYINGDVTVTDRSYTYGGKTTYEYVIEFPQNGVQFENGTGTYDSKAYLVIHPTQASIAGTYSLANKKLDVDSSYLYRSSWNPKYRNFMDYSSTKVTSITFTDNNNGTYTISGTLRHKISGKNTYYYYHYNDAEIDNRNTFTPVFQTVDPSYFYRTEPDAGSFTFNGTNISNYTPAQASNVVLDFGMKTSMEMLELQFNGMNQVAAGEYAVANTGAANTIMASIGMADAYTPAPSYFMSAYYDNYFITGGSVTVSYSDDQQAMTVAGTLTTAHGSTISVNCIGVNPWAPIINADITVSNTTATMNANGYLNIEMTGTPNNMAIAGTCTSITDLTVANLNATNTYVTLVGDATSDINKDAVGNSISIVATGNTEEYKLNATIVCKNGNTYNVKDVIFTCHIPTAWDDEEETDDFTFTAGTLTGIDDMIASKGYVVFNFTQGYEKAKIAIATDSKQLAAGDYSIVASAGK